MNEIEEKVLEVLESGDDLYSMVCAESHQMDKSLLVDLIKELLFEIYAECSAAKRKQILSNIHETLLDRF